MKCANKINNELVNRTSVKIEKKILKIIIYLIVWNIES